MKLLFSTLIFFCLISTCFAQAQFPSGAWFWSDSVQQTSIFFKESGKVGMNTGPIGQAIRAKNLREGEYTVKNNQLSISWKDGKVENFYFMVLDQDRVQIIFANREKKKKKKTYVFRRVVDVEIKEQ